MKLNRNVTESNTIFRWPVKVSVCKNSCAITVVVTNYLLKPRLKSWKWINRVTLTVGFVTTYVSPLADMKVCIWLPKPIIFLVRPLQQTFFTGGCSQLAIQRFHLQDQTGFFFNQETFFPRFCSLPCAAYFPQTSGALPVECSTIFSLLPTSTYMTASKRSNHSMSPIFISNIDWTMVISRNGKWWLTDLHTISGKTQPSDMINAPVWGFSPRL